MAVSVPPQSADICQRLLRGYQFSPSDLALAELSDLYTTLEAHFAWFHAHFDAAGLTLVRSGDVVLLEHDEKELTIEDKQTVVALFLLCDLWFEQGGTYHDLFNRPLLWADLDWFRDGYGRDYLAQVGIQDIGTIERVWRQISRKGLVLYRLETRTLTLRDPAARILSMARTVHQRLRGAEEVTHA